MIVSLNLKVESGIALVEKRWAGATSRCLQDLRETYDTLRLADRDMNYFQQLVGWKFGATTEKWTFKPFGDVTWSKRDWGLVALTHVVEAVTLMHGLMIVHRDLRWANVIRNRDNHRFILIDFDDAVMLGGERRAPAATTETLALESHAPACFAGDHSFEVDVWSLGLLMREVAAKLEPPTRDLLGQLAARVQQHYETLSLADVAREFAGISGLLSGT